MGVTADGVPGIDRVVRTLRWLGTAWAAAGLLAALGCPAPAAAAEPLEINVILSLTGPFAFIGAAERASVRNIETLVNAHGGIDGRPVKMIVEDDQSTPATAVQLVNGVIAKKATVLLGPTYGASCLAVAPIVNANGGPVTYCYAPSIYPPAGSYMFSGGPSAADQSLAQTRFIYAKGWRRAALIASTDAAGQEAEKRFVAAFDSGTFPGLKLVTREHFAPADTSVIAQITKIKSLNPDVIIDATVGTSTATVLRALKDAGLDGVPVISSLGNVIHAQMEQYSAILPREIYFSAPAFVAHDVTAKGPVRDAQQLFFKTFHAQGIDPDVGNSQSWDPTLIVIDALRHAGAGATAKQVLDYIESLHNFPASDGYYDFRDGSQRGIGLNSLVICRWDSPKNTWVTVSKPGGLPLSKR